MVRNLLLILVCGLAAPQSPDASALTQGGLRVLVPPDGAVHETPTVLLVYAVPSGIDVRLHVDGLPTAAPQTSVLRDREDIRHVRIVLGEGPHEIRLVDASSGVERGFVSVTQAALAGGRGPTTSQASGKYAFHIPEREAICSGCHDLPEAGETATHRMRTQVDRECEVCHPGVYEAPNLHGPMAVGACFTCHESDYGPARFGQKAASQAATCGACHEDYLAGVLGTKSFVHGPVAAGQCTVCHDPHGGATTTLLHDVPPGLCLSCHADTISAKAATSLHGKVSCTACHDPHANVTPSLVPAAGSTLCARCHLAVDAMIEAGHPVYGHPVHAADDPLQPGRKMGCVSCHEPHGQDDISKLNIAENEFVQRRFCLKCHT
jgi:predicted CXXCH cytochrome family protein